MQQLTFIASMLVSLVILGLGIAGFVDGCENTMCCESYFSSLGTKVGMDSSCFMGSTIGDSRPMSLQLFMLGLFLTVAIGVTQQSYK